MAEDTFKKASSSKAASSSASSCHSSSFSSSASKITPAILPKELLHANFKVFGKVQGVFFRKYTEANAKRLGLVGWCENADDGTVIGEVEGPRAQVQEMSVICGDYPQHQHVCSNSPFHHLPQFVLLSRIRWLTSEGSPKSRIDKIEKVTRPISSFSFADFGIKR